jgi:peptidyl-prolyl cis-trans isomerase SurA
MVIRHFIAIALALAATAVFAQPSTSAPSSIINIDRVIAVINDEAVTQYELDEAKRVIVQQMKQQNVQPPEADVLDKQILERIIVQRALAQTGKETGVKVDDAQVERAIQRIAQENIPYGKYRDDIRAEMVVQRMREREVESKITVTDAEVDQYLALAKAQSGGEAEYQLAHILVLVPEQATTEQIETRRRRAEDAMRDLRSGADFGKIAASYSDATDALQGGSLGWRSGARLPTVFADTVRTMKVGAISGVLRSATGFHIVKLLDRRANNEATIVEQTHARHILVRVNERSSEAESKAKIERIKDRLDTGAKFEDMAKLNSEDPSASRGGD